MRIRPLVVLGVAAVLALHGETLGVAAGTGTVRSATIIAKLNVQRKANGLPAGITPKAGWNRDCKQHDHYMDVNGMLTHVEDSSLPGYTAGGAWAGTHSVINYGSSWAQGNPFEEAPIHLAQLLQPRLSVSGAYELEGATTVWGCVITLAGYKRADPKTNRVYTYPGPGRGGVATRYVASEGPFTPNQLVGAPARCGQELFVFASGPALNAGTSPNPYTFDVVAARLRPAGGSAVALKIADGVTKIPVKFGGGQLGYYLGPGAAILIPVKPLKPGKKYLASVTMKGNGVTLTHAWSFTTAK